MRVVETRENYLLVEEDGRWAVVERRAGRWYPMREASREGADPNDAAAVRRVIGEGGWSDEIEARRVLSELAAQHDHLAQRVW
jgi:hypothetical protein